jgi:hypothetical protein
MNSLSAFAGAAYQVLTAAGTLQGGADVPPLQ